MKKWQKASIALATVSASMMMAAPAFADDFQGGTIDLSAAGSAQWQNGSNASGTVMDQNSNVSVGQLQADNYYNYTLSNGGSSSQNTYTVDESKHDTTLASSQNTNSNGGSAWTKADDYNTQGASVSQSQSQIIDGGIGDDSGWGGHQSQISGAVSGTASSGLFGDSLAGGVALSFQHQNGSDASQTTMGQSSTVQAGYTQADKYQHDVVNGVTTTNSDQYSGGALVSSTSETSNGGESYTKANDFSNATAGVSQDQNQAIGLDGSGGQQFQAGGALTGQVDSFWLGSLNAPK